MRTEHYSDEEKEKVFSEILLAIEQGKSIRQIIRYNMQMPSSATFYKWLAASEEYAKRYALACEDRAYDIFDDILTIADDSSNDIKQGENGPYLDGDAIQRAKLRIDARKWSLAKMMPKKFGDRMIQAGDEENPIPVRIIFDD